MIWIMIAVAILALITGISIYRSEMHPSEYNDENEIPGGCMGLLLIWACWGISIVAMIMFVRAISGIMQ